MKIRLLLAVTLVVMLLSGACTNSEKQQTAKELLATIPGEAAYTAVINTEMLVKSAGGKVKDATVIELPDSLRLLINKRFGKPGSKIIPDSVFAGKAGIEFSCLALFADEGNLWLVAPLADPQKTKEYFGKNGYNLQSAGEGMIAGRDVVFDDQHIWVSLKDSVANAAAVEGFRRLNSEQSMLVSKYCDELVSLKNGYIDLWDSNVLWRTLGPNASNARMVSAFMFEDGRYASFSADMKGRSVTATGRFLNSDFKDAKCNLATGKLSADAFDVLGDKAQAVAGIMLDSKLMKNIVKAVNTFGGAMPPSTAELLSDIEGPLVLATDELNNLMISVPCKKGKEQKVADAVNGFALLLGNDPGMRLTTNDKNVLISFNGGPQSGMPIRKLGEKLEGAWIGMALSGEYYTGLQPVKELSVALVPSGSTLEFRVKVNF